MTATVFLILLICLLTMRFFFTCMIVLLIGVFILADQPAARADAYGEINHKQDANWEKALNIAATLSAKQHRGHVNFTHGCYAQDKDAFCATAIWYTEPNGHRAFARAIRRGEDNLLYARDVCAFNKAMTLRTCVSFDSGYKSKWVEDDNGDWKQIGQEDNEDAAPDGGLWR